MLFTFSAQEAIFLSRMCFLYLHSRRNEFKNQDVVIKVKSILCIVIVIVCANEIVKLTLNYTSMTQCVGIY